MFATLARNWAQVESRSAFIESEIRDGMKSYCWDEVAEIF